MIPKPDFISLSLWSLVLGCLCIFPVQVFAQTTKPVTPRPAVSAPSVSKTTSSKPTWTELTPLQQQTLKPLASSWVTLSEAHKRKWLEVSKNYPALPPEGQATMHSRMSEWAALSAQQRAEARLNFAKTKELSKQLTAEEKKAKWETYQALSAEDKQKLAANAPPRPTGAAPAVKPVAPQKLATVPVRPVKVEPAVASKNVLFVRPSDDAVPAVVTTQNPH